MMNNAAFQSLPSDEEEQTSNEKTTSPGGGAEVRWQIVARVPGLTPATIMAGRLQAEGIPARTWQEGAGRALGLTVGLLGTGYVSVPEEYVAQAQAILADVDEAGEDWDEEDSDVAVDFDESEGEDYG